MTFFTGLLKLWYSAIHAHVMSSCDWSWYLV